MAVISGRDATVYVNRGTPDAPKWVRIAGPARREERMDFLRHPDYLARLAAVLADPADDAPRLVAADWLDERPENAARLYAEFIRGQVELARPLPRSVMHTPVEDHKACPKCQADARLVALGRREKELLSRHAAAWSAPWEGIFAAALRAMRPVPDARPVEFHRGFVDAVTLPTQAFLGNAAALFAAQPVTRVTLADREPYPWDRERCAWFHPDVPDAGGEEYANLPLVIFCRIEGARGSVGRCKWFDRRTDAVAALSATLVAHGRAAAHLPSLPGMTTARR